MTACAPTDPEAWNSIAGLVEQNKSSQSPTPTPTSTPAPTATPTPTPTPAAPDTKQFRIVAAPSGTTNFPATTLNSGQSANLRAIIYNVTTSTVEREVAASWIPIGSLNSADGTTSNGGKYFQFTATTAGSGFIQAFLDPSESAAGLNSAAVSGLITSNVPAIPANITILGGNNQIGTINTNLGTAFSVFVTTAAGTPVTGANVTFAPASGGGSVTCGTAGVVSTASGIATCNTITLGSSSGNHTYTAVVAGAGSVTFGATAVAAPTPTPTPAAPDTKQFRIVAAPSGTTNFPATTLNSGQSANL
ncbi:MAG: hypothetical protein KGP28_10015, partial [Bdellovibrionales bacterium]|nr:hypothetical protein [Bdellovibrionales bacterium]